MMNSQTSLQTTAHNIANKNTRGFSRQRVETQSNVPVGKGKLRIGMGARPGLVRRINNQFMEKQVEKSGNQMGYTESRSSLLERVETVFNEQTNTGLNQYMTEFFNAFRELSNNPESLGARTMVKETGKHLAKDFQRIDKALGDIREDADFRIAAKVEEINQITKELASLNEKVQQVELNGVPANDERDRRDQLVKDLSKLVNISYGENDDGQLTVTAGTSAVLVSGFSSRELFATGTPEKGTKNEGNFEVFYKPTNDGTPVNVTKQLRGGELGGFLQVRDQVISGLESKIDSLAYTMAKEVNKAHQFGFDRYDRQGLEFFQVGSGEVKDAAETIQLNQEIREDVGKVAVAGAPGSPGDNRIANIISSIQYKKTMEDGTFTVDDYYGSVVGQVGVETQRAKSAQEAQADAHKQLENIRESISGVSLDEEATKMIEFQKTFDASARLIRTADEMMDTVLNLKRL